MSPDPHRCCSKMKLAIIGDCGSVTGFDLTLERCRNCRTYIMDFFWAGSNTSNVITPGIIRHYKVFQFPDNFKRKKLFIWTICLLTILTSLTYPKLDSMIFGV